MLRPLRKLGGVLAPCLLAACSAGPPLAHVGRTRTPIDEPTDGGAAPSSTARGASTESPRASDAPPPPDDVVHRAALPFEGVRGADGALLAKEALLSELARADAICVGERHGDARDHFAQLATIRGLAERQRVAGFELGVGFEMFQRPSQHALDAFGGGRIDVQELVRASQYEKRWGLPIQFYAPQLEAARAARAELIALNARAELTRAIAKDGLSELAPDLKKELPRLDFGSAAHRALFEGLMEGHPEGDLDRMYAAQVTWDETMAERTAEWLTARAPLRKLVILAGRAHCARPGIPERIERRGAFRVVSVLPEVVSGHAAPAEEPSDPQARQLPDAVAPAPESDGVAAELAAAYDYRFILYER